MHIIWTIIIGFVVGLIARAIMPGKDVVGFIWTTLLGIAGAFLGTYIGQVIGHYQQGESAGFLMSLVGAIIILFIYHLIRKQTSAPS